MVWVVDGGDDDGEDGGVDGDDNGGRMEPTPTLTNLYQPIPMQNLSRALQKFVLGWGGGFFDLQFQKITVWCYKNYTEYDA